MFGNFLPRQGAQGHKPMETLALRTHHCLVSSPVEQPSLLQWHSWPSQLLNQGRHIPHQVTSQAHLRAPPHTALVPFSSVFPTFNLFYLFTQSLSFT